MTYDEKVLGLGKMVLDMITDVAVLPAGDAAFGRKTITFPDGRGGKEAVEIIIARKVVADCMEAAAATQFHITPIQAQKGAAS